MLGLLYRCAHKLAPPQLCDLFTFADTPLHQYPTSSVVGRHLLYFVDLIDGSHTQWLVRSVFGLVRFWNALPSDVVLQCSVGNLQTILQDRAKDAVREGCSIDDLCALKWIFVPYGV